MPVPLDYVRTRRNLPFVKRGMRVEVDGKPGRITSGNRSGNLNIRFDGEKYSVNCHPWYKIKYFDKDGTLIKAFEN